MRKTCLPHRKLMLLVLITFLCTLTVVWNSLNYNSRAAMIQCFHQTGNVLLELDNREPVLGSSIFFHETSCPADISDITLTARQACSVESALLVHPRIDVFLLISSPVNVSIQNSRNTLIQRLLAYPNFKVRHIDFSRYVSNTPLEAIHKSGALNSSQWPVSHASDVLRYTTLYKFGGTYLDLDVIVLKPLTEIINFAGAESNVSLGSGIINFYSDRVGREMARDCAEELARTFDGNDWGFNGPGVITRVLERRCNTDLIAEMTEDSERCQGFNVHPIQSFSALSFRKPELFFQNGNTLKIQKILNQSYTIHYWNKLSSNFILDNRLDIPFLKYARIYCPKIYESVGGGF